MYLTQEMYDLILCPHQVTSFTGQSRTRRKHEMLRYSNQIRGMCLKLCIFVWSCKTSIFYEVLHFFRETDKILHVLSFIILPNTIQILNTSRISKTNGVMIPDSLASQLLYPRKTDADTFWIGGVGTCLEGLGEILLLLLVLELRFLHGHLPKPPRWMIVPSQLPVTTYSMYL